MPANLPAAITAFAVPGGINQYLTFHLGGEMFALPIRPIKEILEFGEITAMPLMPSFIRGVINLRGRVLPVIDLSARFGRGASALTRRSCIIVVEALGEQGGLEMGLVVDSVSAVLDVADSDIEPAPAFGVHIRTDFIVGMAKVDGHFVIVLDTDRVLSIEEMAGLAASHHDLAVQAPAVVQE